MNFDREFDVALSLCFKGEWQKALVKSCEILETYGYRECVLHMQLCIYCAMGNIEMARGTMLNILEQGIWLNPFELMNDPDLNKLHNLEEYNNILHYSRVKYEEFCNKTELKIFRKSPKSDILNKLLFIHGRGTNYEEVFESFLNISSFENTDVVTIQSNQPYSKNRFCWDDANSSKQKIEDIIRLNNYHDRILCGVSQGGRIALNVFLESQEIEKLFLVIPALTLGYEELVKLPKDLVGRKIYIISGENDMFSANVNKISNVLVDKGFKVKLHSLKEVGHYLPTNSEIFITEGLNYLNN